MHIDFGSNPYHKVLNASENETDSDGTVEAWWSYSHDAIAATPEKEIRHVLECAEKRDNLQHLRQKQTKGLSGILCNIAHFLYEHVAA